MTVVISKHFYLNSNRRLVIADGPGRMGDAPPMSPPVMTMAVRLRLSRRLLWSELPLPLLLSDPAATPLSACEPLKLPTLPAPRSPPLTTLPKPNDLQLKYNYESILVIYKKKLF